MNILNRLKRLFCDDDFLVLPDFAVVRKSKVAGMQLLINDGQYVIVVVANLDTKIMVRLNAESQEEAEEILRQLTKELME